MAGHEQIPSFKDATTAALREGIPHGDLEERVNVAAGFQADAQTKAVLDFDLATWTALQAGATAEDLTKQLAEASHG